MKQWSFLLLTLLLVSFAHAGLVCIDGVCENDTEAPEDTALFWGKTIDYETSLQKIQRELHTDSDILGGFLDPVPLENCELVDLNEDLYIHFFTEEIDTILENGSVEDFLCGRKNPPGAMPFAHRYAGYQFAKWNELGDGRSLLWGPIRTNTFSQLASTSVSWDFQLKGTGITPYSYGKNGRATLREGIREYLASWALHHLGIPTSLVLGITRETVPSLQTELEDGTIQTDTAAMILRTAPSWLRFGSFQLLQKEGSRKAHRILIGKIIDRYFSFLLNPGETGANLFGPKKSPRAQEVCTNMLNEIILRTAKLAAQWKAHGFCHGAMNTDNMSIIGVTIAYGPFGFMENYDPDWICNPADDKGRYKFSGQENVAMWNVKQFADALAPYVSIPGQVTALGDFFPQYKETFTKEISLKLGFDPDVVLPIDETIVDSILELASGVDYHHFWRVLSTNMVSSTYPPKAITELLTAENAKLFESWWKFLDKRRELSNLSVKEQRKRMLKHNPIYTLREHLLEKAVKDAENGDYSTVKTLRRILKNPFVKDMELTAEEQKFYTSPVNPIQIYE